MEEFIGKIVEISKLNYYILNKGSKITAILKGSLLKNRKKIYVGDNVLYKKEGKLFVITSVLERENMHIRPPVANIDQMLLVLSIKNPEPDLLLLDKQIILCKKEGINPVICINKIDLLEDNLNEELINIVKTYENIGISVIAISTKTGENLASLNNVLKNNTTAFSGGTGVGKSSITKLLLKNLEDSKNMEDVEIGNLSQANKGKHTTKHVKIYNVPHITEETYILDTPGFSSFEINTVEYKDLKKYYPEFLKTTCKYLDCNHVNEGENECNIKQLLKHKKISAGRYERYVYLFNKLKELDDRKYK